MGALELKLFLDVLGDRKRTLDHVSEVLLRLSELLDTEGHDAESHEARHLSHMIDADSKSALELEEVLGSLDCYDLDEFKSQGWVGVPEGMTMSDAETIIDLLDRGKVEIVEE